MDPGLEALLPQFPPMKSFADYDDAADLRASMRERIAMMVAAGVIEPVDWTGVEKKDVQIPTRDGQQIHAVVYRPENVKPGPLCVYFHSGGWTVGWPELWETGFEVLVKELGCTAVGVAYRLAPEHVFPTAANDACDAVKWCVENAGSLGADVQKGVLVAGTSSGANLAAVVSHDAVEKELELEITGVVLMSAFLVHDKAVPEKYRPHNTSWEDHKDAMVLDVRGMNWLLEQYKPDPNSPLISPLLWPGGHKKQPPTYLQVMGMDPLRDASLIYEHVLREEYGVPTKLDVYAGMPHGGPDFLPMLPVARKSKEDLKAGVEWILNKKTG